ncbi:nucleotidyl transferase AbiEii/AbiGii toxin family protein [bacterium]|nr:nucleotidyl transferase AbiEii/AbiGii toxin family protein [bacterium]
MRDYLFNLIQKEPNPIQGKNKIREYLQARILGVIQRAEGMISLAFHGGTALRFLYGLPRYSEDLDFTLEQFEEGYHFHRLIRMIQKELTPEGYTLSVKTNDQKTVHSAFIQFEGLLYETKLSPHPEEKLSVKIEIDTHPPSGATLNKTIIRKYVTLQIQHHDKASLLAGKCNAILTRPYVKGRDIFDVFWYLSDKSWPEPNLLLLNEALKQFGWNKSPVKGNTWRNVLYDKMLDLDWKNVISDVKPFVENEDEIKLLTRENLLNMLIE